MPLNEYMFMAIDLARSKIHSLALLILHKKEKAMNKNTRTAITLILILTLSLLSSACNTVAGVGKDTQKAGEVIEDASGN